MPYKDEAKQREAMRIINKRFRERRKKELEELRKIAAKHKEPMSIMHAESEFRAR